MYHKDGIDYFIVDGHIHFWDASEENIANKYGEGFIRCFYDYQRNLSPQEWVWPLEKFRRYSEQDLIHDVFDTGYVDVGIFQPTYLNEFYRKGFNTTERNGGLARKHPDRLIVNGSFDPREGEAGLERLRKLATEWQLRGVKLYTAEWRGSSKGWKLSDP